MGAALLLAFSFTAARIAAAEVGAQTCAACHEGKGASYKESVHGKKMPLVKGVSFEKSCETCHGAGDRHAEAAGDRSDPGFSTIVKPDAQTCLKCHKGGELKLWDIGAHAANGMDCAECHSVHDGKGRANLKSSSTETCLKCHKQERLAMNMPSHHPVKEGKMECASCHNPHGGEFGNLRAENVKELCLTCHADKAGPFVHEHPPVAEDCGICHEPHGSQSPKLLAKTQQTLCLGCHMQPHWELGNAVKPKRLYYMCTYCHNEIHGSDRKARFIVR